MDSLKTCPLDVGEVVGILQVLVNLILSMVTCSFERKQKWKKVYKGSPLLVNLPEGPQKKFL
jgi:hypothetical protein